MRKEYLPAILIYVASAVLFIAAAVMFMISPMPDMQGESGANGSGGVKRNKRGLALCWACIFFGACSECTMSYWASGFIEKALGIDKATGDILGMAGFAILLGIARISYARFGKHIIRTLFLGMLGAAVCY